VLVAGNIDDQAGAEDDSDSTATTTTPPVKPGVQVDEQLTKGLDILKAKAA